MYFDLLSWLILKRQMGSFCQTIDTPQRRNYHKVSKGELPQLMQEMEETNIRYFIESMVSCFACMKVQSLLSEGCLRIYDYTEDYNLPSQHLCKKLGMRREGLFQEFVYFLNDADGNPIYENTYQYAILKREWEYA